MSLFCSCGNIQASILYKIQNTPQFVLNWLMLQSLAVLVFRQLLLIPSESCMKLADGNQQWKGFNCTVNYVINKRRIKPQFELHLQGQRQTLGLCGLKSNDIFNLDGQTEEKGLHSLNAFESECYLSVIAPERLVQRLIMCKYQCTCMCLSSSAASTRERSVPAEIPWGRRDNTKSL